MNKILDRLFIGDANDGRNTEALQANGITAVFNATQESDNWTLDFKAVTPYLRLNQPDGAPIPFEFLDQFKAFMDQHYQRNKQTVLVHCGAGVSRASTFTILTMMLYEGYDWEKAERLIRAIRPIISPHPALKDSALAWYGNWASTLPKIL